MPEARARSLVATRPAAAEPKRTALDWRELSGKEPPARRWAVAGWLGVGHTSLLVGPGGIGKTLLAQQLASCLALGRPFIDEIPAALRVLFWACEDDAEELWRRQLAIASWLRVDLADFADRFILEARHGQDNALVVAAYSRLRFTPLLEELATRASDCRADVVILDNIAQLYAANENDRGMVTRFMNTLAGALAGRAILLLAHPARAKGSELSGSSAWENVARSRWYLGDRLPDEKPDAEEPPADGARFLARRKANYSSRDWRRFSFRDGVLVPDAVEAAGAAGGVVSHLRDQAADRIALEGLRKLQGMNIWPTESKNSPRYLPRLLLDHKLAEDRGKNELAEAMRRLIGDGRLVIDNKVAQYDNRNPMRGLRAAEAT